MKKIIMLALLGLSITSYSQTFSEKDSLLKFSGSELIEFTNQYHTGRILTYTGGVITALSVKSLINANSYNSTLGLDRTNSKNVAIPTFGIIAGGFLCITGFLTTEFSFKHIKKAGLYLEVNKVGISYKL